MEPMQARHFQLLFVAPLVLACLFSFALPEKSVAGEVKFPSEDPAFKVDLPAGWTPSHDKDGNLNCDPRDDSGYAFSLLLLKEVHSEKELKAELLELAKSMASGANLRSFKLGEVRGTENEGGVQFSEVKSHGMADSTPFVVVVTGFEAQKGRFYAMVSAGTDKADKKHASDYEGIAASIQPLSSKAKGAPAHSKAEETVKDAAAGDATAAQEQSGDSQPTSGGLPTKYADYMIAPDSRSPDGKFGVMYPKTKLCGDDPKTWAAKGCKDYLVALRPFQILTTLDSEWPEFENKNHGGMRTTWAKDGSAVLVTLDQKWGPNDIFLYEIDNGKVSRSTKLLQSLRDLLVSDCKKALPGQTDDCSDFVFVAEDEEGVCQFADSSQVRLHVTASTDPKETPGRKEWVGTADATWDIPKAEFTSQKVTRKFSGIRKDSSD
jgi:hypothetical protein